MGTNSNDYADRERFNAQVVAHGGYVVETWTNSGWYYPRSPMEITLRIVRRNPGIDLPKQVRVKIGVAALDGTLVFTKELFVDLKRKDGKKIREVKVDDGRRGEITDEPDRNNSVEDVLRIEPHATEGEYLLDVTVLFPDDKQCIFPPRRIILQRAFRKR